MAATVEERMRMRELEELMLLCELEALPEDKCKLLKDLFEFLHGIKDHKRIARDVSGARDTSNHVWWPLAFCDAITGRASLQYAKAMLKNVDLQDLRGAEFYTNLLKIAFPVELRPDGCRCSICHDIGLENVAMFNPKKCGPMLTNIHFKDNFSHLSEGFFEMWGLIMVYREGHLDIEKFKFALGTINKLLTDPAWLKRPHSQEAVNYAFEVIEMHYEEYVPPPGLEADLSEALFKIIGNEQMSTPLECQEAGETVEFIPLVLALNLMTHPKIKLFQHQVRASPPMVYPPPVWVRREGEMVRVSRQPVRTNPSIKFETARAAIRSAFGRCKPTDPYVDPLVQLVKQLLVSYSTEFDLDSDLDAPEWLKTIILAEAQVPAEAV